MFPCKWYFVDIKIKIFHTHIYKIIPLISKSILGPWDEADPMRDGQNVLCYVDSISKKSGWFWMIGHSNFKFCDNFMFISVKCRISLNLSNTWEKNCLCVGRDFWAQCWKHNTILHCISSTFSGSLSKHRSENDQT